jgi:hypothetical protein
MFIKLFKSNNPFLLVILLIFSGLLWLDSFINPIAVIYNTQFTTPFYNSILNLLYNYNLLSTIIAFALVFVQAVMINNIVTNNKLIAKNTYLPALFYILLMSSPHSLSLSPVLISNFFLIFVLNNIFNIYDKKDVYQQAFSICFLISIASLFYLPSICFILLIWISFFVYNFLNWREWLISVLGLIAPYLFIATYYFWFDKLEIIVNNYINFFYNLKIPSFEYNIYTYIFLSLLAILILFSMAKMVFMINKLVIKTRKFFVILVCFIILSLISVFFTDNSSITHLEISFIPISILISNYASLSKRNIFNEIIFILLIIVILLNKFL